MFQTTTSIPKLNYSVALKRDNAMMERDTLSVTQPSSASLKYCAVIAEHDFLISPDWTFKTCAALWYCSTRY